MSLSNMQLDALREVANIGSGNAGTALAQMIGRPVDLTVPSARALPIADAVDAMGSPEAERTAVVLPIFGDMDGVVLLLATPEAVETLCGLLGVEPGSDVALSALGEIGNILGSSYVSSIGALAGMEMEPRPPELVTDMLGAIVASVVLGVSSDTTVALVLDSDLLVEGEACALSFVLVPSEAGVGRLLSGLGIA